MNTPGTRDTKGAAQRPRLPLLDRLLNAHPDAPETLPSAADTLEILRTAVRRDLEALMNSRRRRRPLPSMLAELPSSVLNYGIPDPTSGAYALAEVRSALVRDIEMTIRRFEPRLTKVSVTLLGDDVELGSVLRMRIDAELRAPSATEPVTFETLLEPVTREVTVREG